MNRPRGVVPGSLLAAAGTPPCRHPRTRILVLRGPVV